MSDKDKAIDQLIIENKDLKAALAKICHIRNNSHKHNAIGKCSDMWKTAATALKETGEPNDPHTNSQ